MKLVTSHVLAPRVYARSLLWAANVSRQYPSQTFMLSIFDGKILEERIMRLTRNKRRLGAGPARVLMLAAISLLCVSAMSVSMFAFELQTRAFPEPTHAFAINGARAPEQRPDPTVAIARMLLGQRRDVGKQSHLIGTRTRLILESGARQLDKGAGTPHRDALHRQESHRIALLGDGQAFLPAAPSSH